MTTTLVKILYRLKEQLGSGQFGTVYHGLWRKDGVEVDGEMEVAVKSLEKEASKEERVMFLKEAAIMGQFNHLYIVKILGMIDDEPVSDPVNFEFTTSCYAYPDEDCGGIDAKRGPSTSPYLAKA